MTNENETRVEGLKAGIIAIGVGTVVKHQPSTALAAFMEASIVFTFVLFVYTSIDKHGEYLFSQVDRLYDGHSKGRDQVEIEERRDIRRYAALARRQSKDDSSDP